MLFLPSLIPNDLSLKVDDLCKTTIFFGFVSQEGSPRQTNIMRWWVSALMTHEYAFIVNKTSKQNKFYKSLNIGKEYEDLYRNANLKYTCDTDRGTKRIVGLKYFLHNTTCDYYWSLTDDVAVDLHGLRVMIRYLEDNYNPNTDNVFMGESYGHFLQGGTGFVMSRRAAEIVEKRSKEWLLGIRIADDVETDKFRKYLGMNERETYSPFVFGEEPYAFYSPDFYKSNLRWCPNTSFPTSPVYKLTNLVALHAKFTNPNKAMTNLIRGKMYINDIYFYYFRMSLYLCKGPPY